MKEIKDQNRSYWTQKGEQALKEYRSVKATTMTSMTIVRHNTFKLTEKERETLLEAHRANKKAKKQEKAKQNTNPVLPIPAAFSKEIYRKQRDTAKEQYYNSKTAKRIDKIYKAIALAKGTKKKNAQTKNVHTVVIQKTEDKGKDSVLLIMHRKNKKEAIKNMKMFLDSCTDPNVSCGKIYKKEDFEKNGENAEIVYYQAFHLWKDSKKNAA